MEGAVSMRYRVERPSYLKVCLPLTVPSDSHAQTPQLRRTKPFFASDGTETTQSSGITNFGLVLSREHGFGRLSSMSCVRRGLLHLEDRRWACPVLAMYAVTSERCVCHGVYAVYYN
jgi:hypothetical protein